MIYSELYEYLDAFSESTDENIVKSIMNDWNNNQIESFVGTLFQLVKMDFFEKPSFFNFYSNSTLAGGSYPCAAAECRLRNLDSFTRYASLYADKVLIPSPIDTFIEDVERGNQINKMELAISILIILRLKPLVLAGIVGFFSTYICLCQNCLEKVVKKEENIEKQLKAIESFMNLECASNIKCFLSRDNQGSAYFSITGAEKYGYHELTDIIMLKESRRVKNMLKKSNGKVIEITSKQLNEFGIVNHLLQPAINDIFQAQINTSFTDSSYITDRLFDIQVMEHLNIQNINGGPKVITNDLFHKVPLIGNADINDIIDLRKKDGEAFLVYRDNINKILKTNDILDSKVMMDIQRDYINPELHEIKRTIKNNRNGILKSTVKDVFLLSAGVGVGIFTGILPIDYAAVMGVIGGIPTISNITSSIVKGASDDSVKNNKFYFLYELEKKSEAL